MEDQADTPIDLEKLRRALETVTLAFRVSRRLTFPDDDHDLKYALVEYGRFGTLPNTRPLERHVEASPAAATGPVRRRRAADQPGRDHPAGRFWRSCTGR